MSMFARRLQTAVKSTVLPETTVSTSNITDTGATLNWTTVAGATGYKVGRNGTDSNGNGPWETTVSAGTTSQSFIDLIPSTSYTLYCEPLPGGVRKSAAITTQPQASNQPWSDTNLPWMLQSGESVDDNKPAGVTIMNYENYSNSGARSFGQTMSAIRSAATSPYYVRIPAGTYHVTDFSFAAGAGVGRGYQDISGTKYWGGLIGAGANQTVIVVDPDSMSQQQLDGVSSGSPSPVAMSVFYAGSTGLPIPTFFSGITFRGSFQQSIALNGLSGTAPAPYAGLNLVSTKPGSFVQYCRFQGFGFTAKNSPPYELGSVSSLRSSYTIRRCEMDGRLAQQVDPARPVAAGGLMWNYETDVKAIDIWMHHTRRSGWAMHDHDPTEGGNASDQGIYYGKNIQTENIANTSDSYAGSLPSPFSPSNVEELRRTFTYDTPRFTSTLSNNAHIVLGTSNGNSVADAITVLDPIIGNSTYNSCLVIRIIRTPNSQGTSPYYTLYQSGGLGALPFDVKKNGVSLTPVLSTSFNSSTHTPSNSYIVITS